MHFRFLKLLLMVGIELTWKSYAQQGQDKHTNTNTQTPLICFHTVEQLPVDTVGSRPG